MRMFAVISVICLTATLGCGSDTADEAAPGGPTAQSEDPLRVFFIGNSHTGCNHLIEVVRRLAFKGQADTDMVTAGHVVGGCTLERHWNEGSAMAKVMKGKWDIVVLQENGQGPLAYPDKMRHYAKLFNDKIKQTGAKPILFMTAAYQDHPDTTQTIVKVHLELGKALNVEVAPVGLAFAQALKKRPSLTLHNLPDTVHANQQGTYLTASVIWATLTGKKPHGLSQGGLAEVTEEEAGFLQGMAWESILAYRERNSSHDR